MQSHIRMINDRKQQCKGSNLRTQKHCTPYKLTTETQVLSMHQCLRLGVALVEQEKMATVGSWSRFRFLLDESLFFCLSVRFCINCCHCYPDCALVWISAYCVFGVRSSLCLRVNYLSLYSSMRRKQTICLIIDLWTFNV